MTRMKKSMSLLLAGFVVLGNVSLVSAATGVGAQYNVYQYDKYLQGFGTYEGALAYARQWDHSSVVRISGSVWVWDNYPKYRVYQYDHLLREYSSQQEAIQYASMWDHSVVRSIAGNAWVWDNYPKYRVYQFDRQLRECRTVDEAVAYARLWDHASVRQISNNQQVWDNYKIKTIVLDPGHGGQDPGAIAPDGTQEKSLTLAFGLKTRGELAKHGYNVVMVRDRDAAVVPNTSDVATELQARVDVAKKSGASLYVSIHANIFSNGTAYGSESYFNSTNNYDGSANPFPVQSQHLASILQQHTLRAMGTYNRGVKNSDFYVLRKNTVPATLVEIGFLSNSSDLKKMKDPALQQTFAAEVAAGIDEYFASETK
jgi:N-acetylmuramoyl-L-alanine amidase CwlD